MKKLATAIVAFALIGTPAFAQAPSPPPAPVYNWTGWYAGVNAGASFGNVNTNLNVAPVTVFQLRPSPGVTGLSGPPFPGFGFSDRTYPSGFMGGGQIGYNWQFSPIWVVGLEADFQGALERDSSTLTNNFSGFIKGFAPGISAQALVTGSTVPDYQTQIDWFGTVRLALVMCGGTGMCSAM